MSKILHSALMIGLMVFSFQLQATLIAGTKTCHVDDVKVTSYQKQDGSPAVTLSPNVSASACLGAYTGNDATATGDNLGYDTHGFLNDKTLFPDYGAFLAADELQDLEFAGNFKDPGWIFVGKQDMESTGPVFEAGVVQKGTESYTFSSDILTMQNCKDKDGVALTNCNADAVSGEWVYKPPQLNPQILLDLLGINKFFDQAAVVFKSGTQFAIYNFRLADFGLPPVLGTADENYIFTGTWNMYDTLVMEKNCPPRQVGPCFSRPGLSHVSLWLRDPSITQIEVPEPTSIALLALGLLGLRLRRNH